MIEMNGGQFVALLSHADSSQAAFARLAGVTPRQVNNWCRDRAAVPAWAALLALILQHHSPAALAIMAEEALRHFSDLDATGWPLLPQ